MKCLLIFLALAAAFTIALSPSVNRRIWYRVLPETPAGLQPKYVIGGRIVTREVFEQFEPNGDPEL